MNRPEIRRAYDSVAPDSAARERMLDNILSAVSAEQPDGRRAGGNTKVLRPALCLAAVIALLLAFGITVLFAAAANFAMSFKLEKINMTESLKSVE